MTNFEDWISQLPDEILVTILSLSPLNIVEASNTCVLSRRWQYLWTHVKVLNFYFPKMLRAIDNRPLYDSRARNLADKYVHWVNRVLQVHQCPHITDFKVVFFLNGEDFFCEIDEWFSFAIRKSVQRLELNLSGYTHLGERLHWYSGGCDIQFAVNYTPTNKVYSLIKSPYGLSCIKSLTQLSLICVNVTGVLVEHFLSNCPLLFELRVSLSEHLVNLKIAGPSLCLKILELTRCPRLKTVDIYAPNLASLTTLGFWHETHPVLVRHAPSLVDLTVALREGFFDAFPASYFSNLESLTLIFDESVVSMVLKNSGRYVTQRPLSIC